MTQQTHIYKSSCPAIEINRLLTYIGQNTIDSERSLIQPDEIPAVVNCLIQRLIWQHPHLDQVLQEILDDLRYGV
ncbi:hypothetical protein [Leptolyngbya sp. GGD]|uniref:hypothetical protein n=1 Tax=Leptolyngbya sp. GGD TaxID=2997907 RepID=UPI00227D3D7C|nr:hypothetical protein [Leptolyngbya sp. GGD]MCY6493385.1 hypothetical protein [Leptolyngbya sp. GGD]